MPQPTPSSKRRKPARKREERELEMPLLSRAESDGLAAFVDASAALWATTTRSYLERVVPLFHLLEPAQQLALMLRARRAEEVSPHLAAALVWMYLHATRQPFGHLGTLTRRVADHLETLGVVAAPYGVGVAKIGGPASYRPTEETCPKTCSYFGDCYAFEGRVRPVQMRANAHLLAQGAALAGMIMVASRQRRLIRLHVSGDFLYGDELDVAYLQTLETFGRILRVDPSPQKIGRHKGMWAWTYTHVRDVALEDEWVPRLADVGVSVLISDRIVAGGAVVWPHDEGAMAELREHTPDDVKLEPCLQQTHGIDCNACLACTSALAEGRCIVLAPHGGHATRMWELSRKALGIH